VQQNDVCTAHCRAIAILNRAPKLRRMREGPT
jgi:hypothetical protein